MVKCPTKKLVKCPRTCPRPTASQLQADRLAMARRADMLRDDILGEEEISVVSMNSEVPPEFDVVLADQRRPPTVEDEVVYLLVSHFFEVLYCSWEGEPILKPEIAEPIITYPPYAEDTELFGEDALRPRNWSKLTIHKVTDIYKARSKTFSKENLNRKRSKTGNKSSATQSYAYDYEFMEEEEEYSVAEPDWRLLLPDQQVNILFLNGAWYEGRVSRRLMEGPGLYTWEEGASFQGEFISGLPWGDGRLEFPDMSFYEGQVYKAFRHGEGLQCMYDSTVMYTGNWWLGLKHGPGLIFYDEPWKGIDFYKGNWEKGLKEGFGVRQYPSGARYIGFWSKGRRHGRGVMFWANHDIYRGQWKCGVMHGYGEYTWSGFVNKTFSYPAGNTYRGMWVCGKRQGRGILEMVHGAVINTSWENNLKQGPGNILCCNGSNVQGDRLFMEDKVVLINEDDVNETGLVLQTFLRKLTRKRLKKLKRKIPKPGPRWADDEKMMQFLSKNEIAKQLEVPLNSATHTMSLRPHLMRLAKEKNKELHEEHLLELQEMGGVDELMDEAEETFDHFEDTDEFTVEEKFLRRAVMLHLCRMQEVYQRYATIACEEPVSFRCVLMRIFLWQLLKDHDLHSRGVVLVTINDIIGLEEYLRFEQPQNPFERIEFWQFVHIMILLSWVFYGQYIFCKDLTFVHQSVSDYLRFLERRKDLLILSPTFQYFLENDIYPMVTPNGEALSIYKDVAPLEGMYLVYKRVGESHTARVFLNSACVRLSLEPNIPPLTQYFEQLAQYKKEGRNTAAVAGELMYLHAEKPLNFPELFPMEKETSESYLKSEMVCVNDLRPKAVVECLSQVCPGIKEDGLVIDMEYKLTFLEFYETILLCVKTLLLRNARREARLEVWKVYKAEMIQYELLMEEYKKQLAAAAKKGKPKK